jgi:hypothetical protein
VSKLTSEELRKKWAKVLESDIGTPIKSTEKASVLANIIESEVKLNNNYALNRAERRKSRRKK